MSQQTPPGAEVERLEVSLEQLRPARAIPLSGAVASHALDVGHRSLRGWSIRETAGAAAIFRLRNGQDAGGELVASVSLAANASSMVGPTDPGVRCNSGVFLEVVAGAIEGAVYVGG